MTHIMIQEHAAEIVDNCSDNTDETEMLSLVFEAASDIWADLVSSKSFSDYTLSDMIETAPASLYIIGYAKNIGCFDEETTCGHRFDLIAYTAYQCLVNCLFYYIGETKNER